MFHFKQILAPHNRHRDPGRAPEPAGSFHRGVLRREGGHDHRGQAGAERQTPPLLEIICFI